MIKKIVFLSLLSTSILNLTADSSDPRVYGVAGVGSFLTCAGITIMYNACKLKPSIISLGTAPLKFGIGLTATAMGTGLMLNARELVEKYDEFSKNDKVHKVKRKVNMWAYYIDEKYQLSDKWASLRKKVSNFFDDGSST